VGVDVGIANFAALSTGQLIPALNIFRKQEAALVHAQRRLSHIQEFSNKRFSKNWKKAKTRVQRLHARIAAARLDFLHKLTYTISKNHAIVCIENLRIMNMMKSAAGTVEEPGTSVAAKSGLNKSISKHSWGEFFRQLGYKLEWNGGRHVAVPARNTSRTCPECGCVSPLNRPTQARFCCIESGYETPTLT
jgi:putative transposase